MSQKGAYYSDKYFKYLFNLMKYGAGVQRRRIRAKIFLFLQYDHVKLAILNDINNKRLVIFVYFKDQYEGSFFKYIGTVNIYGYYPKQVRKILYNLQNNIRDNVNGYRDSLQIKDKVISRSRAWNYKRLMKFV